MGIRRRLRQPSNVAKILFLYTIQNSRFLVFVILLVA
uniref:Uncharacterized protein n=1 Tax=Arundo donax TaxID=35708 RepID=A0A0A9EZV2_ARUDO